MTAPAPTRSRLSRRAASSLVAFAVWSWIIWLTFLKNIWADSRSFDHGPTAFLLIHLVLIVVSLLFGTAIGWLGWRSLRPADRRTSAARDPQLGSHSS